jgi:Uma2 family endonuclease
MTADEYAWLEDDGTPTELVRGAIVEGRFTYPFEGFVCANVGRFLGNYLDEHQLGRAAINVGVITERNPDTVRAADVCFFSFTRLPGLLPDEGYGDIAPDLVFEVVSRSDWNMRVQEYLTAGVTAVCVVNPRDRTATVYRDNQNPEPFAADAELTLPDVLPGFRVPLRQFFE